jgi:hypothetical protein
MKTKPEGEKLIRSITPEVRVVDALRGIVDYVASDETVDHYRELILARGWRFSHFSRNAPFVDSHNYECIDRLLGKVLDFKVEGRQLVERVQWAVDVPENALAKLGWEMTRGGYLKAVSVGFYVTKAARNGGAGWDDAATAAGIDPKTPGNEVSRIFVEQEQVELSACILGANPSALVRAFEDGQLHEEELVACGIGDDEYDFLREAGQAWDRLQSDTLMRKMISLEMQRIYGSRKKTSTPATTKPESASSSGAETAETERRRRDEFLTRLRLAAL